MNKIVHITTAHSARDVRVFEKECRTLAAAGHEVILLAPADGDGRIDRVSIRALRRYEARWKRMTIGAWRAYRIARGLRPDVYHLHDPELLPWAQLLRRGGCAVIFDMHEDLRSAILTKPWLPACIRKPVASVMAALERPLMTGLTIVYAEESYAPQYPWVKESEVVLNLPQVDRLLRMSANAKPTTKPVIGYTGSVTENRGSLTTVEALRLLADSDRSVSWECVGPMTPTHREELERAVDEAGLRGVTFHGYQLPETSWRLMADCSIGLAVLQAHPNYVSSYPTKMFEYMALGLPVIVSDFPLWREVVDTVRCGLLVPPDDPQQLAQAITELLDDPAEARAMGARGKAATTGQYNWATEAEKLLALYRRILAAPAA